MTKFIFLSRLTMSSSLWKATHLCISFSFHIKALTTNLQSAITDSIFSSVTRKKLSSLLKINYFMVAFTRFLSSIKNNHSPGPFFIHNSVTTFSASDRITSFYFVFCMALPTYIDHCFVCIVCLCIFHSCCWYCDIFYSLTNYISKPKEIISHYALSQKIKKECKEFNSNTHN